MKPQDELLQRYREANAHDPARPDPALREKVLAEARTAAAQARETPGHTKPQAANDSAWRWRAFGGLAVLGLATLVVLQFDGGTPEEREIALGEAQAPSRAAAPAEAPAAAQGRVGARGVVCVGLPVALQQFVLRLHAKASRAWRRRSRA